MNVSGWNVKEIGVWLFVMVALTVVSYIALTSLDKEIKLMALTSLVGVLSAATGFYLRGKIEEPSVSNT